MPDSSDLASVIAGTDPLSPQVLQALQAQQARDMVANPANWQNQGLFGGLARTLAGVAAPNPVPQVAQIAAQRQAALPDEAKLLSTPDPYSTLAANPNQYSPLAQATLLNGATPTSVADARLKAAQAAYATAQARLSDRAGAPKPPMYLGGIAALANAGQPQGATAPTGSAGGGNWEVAHNNFAGMRNPNVAAAGDPNANPNGWQSFATPEEGLGAISQQLDRYAAGGVKTATNPTGAPLNTLRGIVSTWAPPNENPTDQLVARASAVTGFHPDQQLNVSDPATKAKLVEAMIRNEQGGNLPVDPNLIAQVAGVKAASSGAPAQASPQGGPSGPGAPLAQVGQGQPAQPQPGASGPGAPLAQVGQIAPAYIAEAQLRASRNATLGRQTPQFLNEAAALPFVGPKAVAEQAPKTAGEIQVNRSKQEDIASRTP